MTVKLIVDQLTVLQQKLSAAPLRPEESQDLINLFNQAVTSAIPEEDRAIIFSLKDRVTENPKVEDLNKISKILMRYCPDDMIIKFLGLDTWQSRGDVDKATGRIITCFKDQDKVLDLTYLSLTSLPMGIGQLSQLVYLNCGDNPLTSLPESIGQLSGLISLYCLQNQLTSLPASIGQLSQLRELICSHNQLTSLPASIGQLSQLRELICSHNQLTSLPESIGQLSQLRALKCSNNSLTFLPESMGQLSQLRELYCGANQLTSLPLSLQRLDVNTRMNFFANQISSLPPELSHLDIDLSNQRIIRQANNQNVNRLANIQRNNAPPSSFDSLKQAVSDRRQDLKKLELSKLKEDERLWSTVSLWLDKLAGTTDFMNTKIRPVFAERVLSILKLAEENEAYRETMSAILMEALSSCSDRATLPLCPLEIQKVILESSSGTCEQMLKVLKGAFASELLNVCAGEFMLLHRGADEIEVYLGFQLKLKEHFHIPIGVEGMSYFACSQINDMDLAIAMNKVARGLQDAQAFTQFLIEQPVWTEKLRKEFSKQREAVLAEVDAKLEALDDRLFAGELTDQAYNDQSNALKAEFKSKEAAWLKIKTEEICLSQVQIPNLLETVITIKCKDLPSNQDLYIRGNRAGLDWNRGVKLVQVEWDTFEFRTHVSFAEELEFKLLINDESSKWEAGSNHKIAHGKKVECMHAFTKELLPPLKKTVIQLDFTAPEGKTLFLRGTGPLGNWSRETPMRCIANNRWMISLDGEFKDFEYKLLLDQQFEEGPNRTAKCGKIRELKRPRFPG